MAAIPPPGDEDGSVTGLAEQAIAAALAPDPPPVTSVEIIDGGRGVFSTVVRCHVVGGGPPLVVKLPRFDANGDAAVASGAYEREVVAYRDVLPVTPDVGAPAVHGIVEVAPGRPAFVLDDLGRHRAVDQGEGLTGPDVAAIAAELVCLHQRWSDERHRRAVDAVHGLRRSTPSTLSPAGVGRGVELLGPRWGDEVDVDVRLALSELATAFDTVVGAFADVPAATLCHGDPRADNAVFDRGGRAILFDWQQMAVQFGEADLAWLLATSVTPEVRRSIEADVIASYALAIGQDAATTWRRYRIGSVLPGLAVLFLAQREADDPATRRMIVTSLRRIGAAVIDLEPVSSPPT